MAVASHLEFAKIAGLVTRPTSACDSSSPFQISHYSANMSPRYSQKTIFNMASVRYLEFTKFRSFVKCPSSEWKFASAYQIWSKSDNVRLSMEKKLFTNWRSPAILSLRKKCRFGLIKIWWYITSKPKLAEPEVEVKLYSKYYNNTLY